MNTTMIRSLMYGCFITIILAIGCTTVAGISLKGGKIVKADYQPKKVLVSYRTEGEGHKNKYYLVETEEGEAMLEKTGPDGLLYTTHWRDDLGDHFSSWQVAGPAWEFIVPLDRTKQASKYAYPANQYDVGGKKRGIGAVTPHKTFQPAIILIPE